MSRRLVSFFKVMLQPGVYMTTGVSNSVRLNTHAVSDVAKVKGRKGHEDGFLPVDFSASAPSADCTQRAYSLD